MGSLEKRYAEALLSLADNAEQADIVDSALGVLGRLYNKNAEFRSLMLNPVISNNNRSETLFDILEMLGYIKNGSDISDGEERTRKNHIKASIQKKEIQEMVSCAAKTDDCDLDEAGEDSAEADEITSMDIETTATVADAGILLLRFLQLLLDKGRLAFLPNIAEEYHRIKSDNRKTIRIIVRSSAPLESKMLYGLCEKYKIQYGAATAEINNIIEPALLGGINIQIGDVRVDETIYGRLATLARAVAAGADKQTAGMENKS